MEDLKKIITEFRAARGWDKINTPANLSRSIVIEAAELLEHFQWQDNNYNKKEVCDELADVLIYALSMCYNLEVDPKEIIKSKLIEVEKKYPVKNL